MAEILIAAERRWAALGFEQPDLAPAISLQRRLVRRTHALAAMIGQESPPRIVLDTLETVSRLEAGRPVFSGKTVKVDADRMESFVLAFCDDLSQGVAGAPAKRLRNVLAEHKVDLGSLLAASLMRQLQAIRTTANHVGVAPDLLWLVAELGAAPLAHRLQSIHLTDASHEDQRLRASLIAWDSGRCPACGSWPALAEIQGKTRNLRCSFCGAGWKPITHRCIYCDETGEPFTRLAVSDTNRTSRGLELCRSCGGYLKNIEVKQATPFELVPVEDLASNDLDRRAANQGYTRPPMREIDAI